MISTHPIDNRPISDINVSREMSSNIIGTLIESGIATLALTRLFNIQDQLAATIGLTVFGLLDVISSYAPLKNFLKTKHNPNIDQNRTRQIVDGLIDGAGNTIIAGTFGLFGSALFGLDPVMTTGTTLAAKTALDVGLMRARGDI